jgi:hypothetical protein
MGRNRRLSVGSAGQPDAARRAGLARLRRNIEKERRTHLTENGAVTLCGRAITNKWGRNVGAGDRTCRQCHETATAIAAAYVASGNGREDTPKRVVPA